MVKRLFHWLFEQVKGASDRLVLFVLRSTSWFGRELTADGKTEQRMWREQRLRDLRGLALTSRRKRNEPKE